MSSNITALLTLLNEGKASFSSLSNLTSGSLSPAHNHTEWLNRLTPAQYVELTITLRSMMNNNNSSNNMLPGPSPDTGPEPMAGSIEVMFYILYALICLIGLVGNSLVFYAVVRTPTMHNVTNVFIANLALADILLCIFAVPITPLYLIAFKHWIFGSLMCHLLPFAQGVSVYISAFTLMSIAIDRYFVILHPFRPRMQMTTCIWVIVAIWGSTCVLTAPLGHFMHISNNQGSQEGGESAGEPVGEPDNSTVELGEPLLYCDEQWPSDDTRKMFGLSTSILQFVIPFIIITFCYTLVCRRLSDRAKKIPGSVSVRREEQERERARKTNAMLISMVVIFVVSWLPFNIHNLIIDFHKEIAEKWKHPQVIFHLVHATAMASTCYNIFLYAWLNESFRKEFKSILPCFSRLARRGTGLSFGSQNRRTNGSTNPTATTACHVKVKVCENNVV